MALRLDLELGAGDAFSGLDKWIAQLKGLRGDIKSLTEVMRGLGTASRGVVADFSSEGKSARDAAKDVKELTTQKQKAAKVPPPVPYVGGANQQLAKAQFGLHAARNSGDPALISDAEAAVKKAQQSLARQNELLNPTKQGLLQQLMMGSRLAIGPSGNVQMMPLMRHFLAAGGNTAGMLNLAGGAGGAAAGGEAAGAVAGAAGGLGAAGPIGLALAAAAAAALAFAAVMKLTISTVNEFTHAQIRAGGTGAQTASLMRVGAALGIDASSQARSLGEKVWTDGIAKGFASQLGIDTRGGTFGNLNDADKYLTALRAITDPSRMSDDQATRMARAFGMEQELLLRKASPETRARALDRAGRMSSPQEQQAAADAEIEMNLALNDLKLVLVELGAQYLPMVVQGFRAMGDALNMLTLPIRMISMIDPIDLILPGMGKTVDRVRAAQQVESGAQREAAKVAAEDSHTRAMNDHTRALKDNTETIGAGKNTRGAVRAAWRYQNLDQAMRGAAAANGGGVGSITV